MEKTTKDLFDLVLRDNGEAPFTYEAYHQYLSEKGCEETLEFLADAIQYQKLASLYFPDSITSSNLLQILEYPDKIPFPKKPASFQLIQYEDDLVSVKQQWMELCEKYILPGSPRQISIQSAYSKAIEELLDMGYFHPDILKTIFVTIYDRLFDGFQSFLETQKLIAAFETEKLALDSHRRHSDQNTDHLANLPSDDSNGELSQTESRNSIKSPSSTTKKKIIVSNRVAASKGSGSPKLLAVVTNPIPVSPSPLSPASQSTSPIVDVTFEQVINNSAPPPYSRNDYHTYLENLRSEENLEFLIEVLHYRELATKFYKTSNSYANTAELLEKVSTLSPSTKPDGLDDQSYSNELEKLKITIQEISNNFLKPEAPKEVNLPSKVIKPLMSLLEGGHYNPEVLAESYSHIYDMLHQNGFDHFLKHASAVVSPTSPDGTKKGPGGSRLPSARQSVTETSGADEKASRPPKIMSSGRSAATAAKKKSKLVESSASESGFSEKLRSLSGSMGSLNDEESVQSESIKSERKIIPSGRSAYAKKLVSVGSQSKTSVSNSVHSGSLHSERLDSIDNYDSPSRDDSISRNDSVSRHDSTSRPSGLKVASKALSNESISQSSIDSVDINDSDRAQPKIIPSSRIASRGPSPPPKSPEGHPKGLYSPPKSPEINEEGEEAESKAAHKVIASIRSAAPIATGRAASSTAHSAIPENSEEVENMEPKAAPKVIASGRSAAIPMASGRSAVSASSRATSSGRSAVPRSVPSSRSAIATPNVIPSTAEEDAALKDKKGIFGFAKKK